MGRFCLNCGHRVGEPVADDAAFIPWQEESLSQARQRLDEESTSRPPWVAWTLGAAGLVAAVLLLAAWVGDDGSPTGEDKGADAASSASPRDGKDRGKGRGSNGQQEDGDAEAAPEAPADPRELVRQAQVEVPATAPPTTDLDGQLVAYDAARMLDGRPATAWRMPGDGTGASITLTLPSESVITRVGLLNGYAKQVSGVDWYPNNRRVLAARWTFDDGTTVEQPLTEVARLQTLAVGPLRSTRVVLTLVTVSPPGPGSLGRDYTAISGVSVVGAPVG